MPTKHDEKLVTLFNTGALNFRTSKGEFGPKGTIKVPQEEADRLLTYEGVVDAAKYSKPDEIDDADVQGLHKQIEDLTARNVELEKQLVAARSGKGGGANDTTGAEGGEGSGGRTRTKIGD